MFDAVTISKYGGVLATLILSGFGLPIPEEIPVVTAGAMVGHDTHDLAAYEQGATTDLAGAVGGGPAAYWSDDQFPGPSGVTRWWIMLPLCIFGAVLSDTIIFTAGRLWGRRLLKSGWVQRHLLPPEKAAKIEANFHKHGILILLGARFTPGVRSPVFLMAGVLKMPFQRFLLADALYAIPGINLLFWLAYVFTDQFVAAVHAVERHRPMAIAAVVAAVGGIILYKLLTTRTITEGNLEEIPTVMKPVGAVTAAVEKGVEKTIEIGASAAVKAASVVVDRAMHPLGHHPKPPAPETTSPAPATPETPSPDPQPK
jgi:membrane protein DedA with SNARE-associated domain